MTPFFANYGYNPRFLTQFQIPSDHVAPTAVDFATHLHEVQERLVENVKAAQDSQARYCDAQYERVEFQPSDMVWLNASNISTSRPSKKLNWKRLCPYKVVKHTGLQAYQLALPPTMRQVHSVFQSPSSNSSDPHPSLLVFLRHLLRFTSKTTDSTSKLRISWIPNAMMMTLVSVSSISSSGRVFQILTSHGNPKNFTVEILANLGSPVDFILLVY
jgi:hypothetical protein